MYTKNRVGRKPASRKELVRQDPGLGMLAARLLFAVQDELYRRLEAAGYRDLRPRHGIVIAYLDDRGSRATELAALSGRHKQLVGAPGRPGGRCRRRGDRQRADPTGRVGHRHPAAVRATPDAFPRLRP
jgi:hypothetical protein